VLQRTRLKDRLCRFVCDRDEEVGFGTLPRLKKSTPMYARTVAIAFALILIGDHHMVDIEIYTKQWCAYCTKAKALLSSKSLVYREVDITSDTEREDEMIARSQRHTVPQIFIAGQSIGGYDDLRHLNATGELDRLLRVT
jgi:glutaredoxin 3